MLGLGSRSSTLRPALQSLWQANLGGHVISLCTTREAIAAAIADGPITILEANSGKRQAELPGHRSGISQIAWRNSEMLASGGCDGLVRIWNPQLGTEILTLEAGADWVERVAWSPSGQYLACAAGRNLTIWDFNHPTHPHQRIPAQQSTVADIAWKPGHENILASCGYNGLAFWSPTSPEPTRKFDWKGSMLALAWSPDGKYIATGNQDSTIQFWNIESAKELHMSGYRAKIRELSWDCTSRFLATGGSATAVVWDCSGKGPAGSTPRLLDFHSSLLTQLAFQHNGSLLAAGCNEGLLSLWRAHNETLLATSHLGSAITQISWAPSNRRFAAATASGLLKMIDATAV
jgi:WD40 repeat protein